MVRVVSPSSQLQFITALLRNPSVKTALRRAAQAGSFYAVMWLGAGGWIEHPWEMPGVTLRLFYTVLVTLTEYIARGWKPVFSEWTLGFEIARSVSRAFMTHYGHRITIARNARIIRTQTAILGTLIGYIFCPLQGTRTEALHHNGLEHMWIRRRHSPPSKVLAAGDKPVSGPGRVVVLFFHGGGYAVNSPRMYIPFGSEFQYRLQAKMREQLGHDDVQVDILLANYRKIPEHPYPTPPLDALTTYKHLVLDLKIPPRQIIVAGDSAGAGLAIATMLRIRDSQPELMPVAGILACPYVDLEIPGDERKVPYCILADKPDKSIYDTYHPREGHPSTWGDASAVHCDLSGLPPAYIQAAELDYVLPHAKRLMQKATDDGLKDWHMETFPNVSHVFQNFPPKLLPSAGKAIDAMAAYAAEKFTHAHQFTSSG